MNDSATPTLDLAPQQLVQLLELLRQTVPDAEVWAYGSRVTHTAHEGSDLDLVVRRPDNPEAPRPDLHRLRDALAESNLPIVVEVLDWARLPEAFRREVQRCKVVLHAPQSPAAS